MAAAASQRSVAPRSSVPGEQRVFSLVLALVASPQGATKRELLSSVYGYADRYQHGERSDALERQFERDKDQLRAIGIPIDTIDSPEEPGNTQLTRYRISKELLQVPRDLRFSERELTLLRLAAMAWREGSLTAESRRAAMKLESLGAGLDVQHLGVSLRLGIPEPAAPALQSAIDAGRVVGFDYQLPHRDAPLGRRVAPLRLHRADGRWHLIAHDLDRDDERVFLLSRIVGGVRTERESFDPALRDRVDAEIEELLRLERVQRATLEVRRGSVAEARLSPRAASHEDAVEPGCEATVRLELGTLDYRAFAEELAAFGADVAVVEPPELRSAVIAELRGIAGRHTVPAAGSAERGTD